MFPAESSNKSTWTSIPSLRCNRSVHNESLRAKSCNLLQNLDLPKRVIKETEAQNRVELARFALEEIVDSIPDDEVELIGIDTTLCIPLLTPFDFFRPPFYTGEMCSSKA